MPHISRRRRGAESIFKRESSAAAIGYPTNARTSIRISAIKPPYLNVTFTSTHPVPATTALGIVAGGGGGECGGGVRRDHDRQRNHPHIELEDIFT